MSRLRYLLSMQRKGGGAIQSTIQQLAPVLLLVLFYTIIDRNFDEGVAPDVLKRLREEKAKAEIILLTRTVHINLKLTEKLFLIILLRSARTINFISIAAFYIRMNTTKSNVLFCIELNFYSKINAFVE